MRKERAHIALVTFCTALVYSKIDTCIHKRGCLTSVGSLLLYCFLGWNYTISQGTQTPRPRSSRQTCLFLYGSLDLLDSLISLKF